MSQRCFSTPKDAAGTLSPWWRAVTTAITGSGTSSIRIRRESALSQISLTSPVGGEVLIERLEKSLARQAPFFDRVLWFFKAEDNVATFAAHAAFDPRQTQMQHHAVSGRSKVIDLTRECGEFGAGGIAET